MKLRPRTPGAVSAKGKEKIEYAESSDEEEVGMMPSDSDHDAPADEGDNLMNELQDNSGQEVVDLNLLVDSSGDYLRHNVPKRRKKNFSNGRGGQRHKSNNGESKEEGQGGVNGDIGPDINRESLEATVAELPAEKPGRRQSCRKKKKDKTVLIWEVMQQANERWIMENSGINMDLLNEKAAIETAEPSSDLIISLLRYQKEWLAWALKQEASNVKGGILADEMGMGKCNNPIPESPTHFLFLSPTCFLFLLAQSKLSSM